MTKIEQVLEIHDENTLDIVVMAFLVAKEDCKIIEHADCYEVKVCTELGEKTVYLDKQQQQVGVCTEELQKNGFDVTPFNP